MGISAAVSIDSSSRKSTEMDLPKSRPSPTSQSAPFPSLAQLADMDPNAATAFLPGNPRIKLSDTSRLYSFLQRDLNLGDLERMAPRLWMLTTPSYANVTALHRQEIKARRVVVAEDHKLHLVWYYDRVFIKPLPRYLLSAAFWEKYMVQPRQQDGSHGGGERREQREQLSRAAIGFLRTYAYLVRHESDFRVAQREDLQLIPKDVTWERFCEFIRHFEDVPSQSVAQRYHYGEVRLSRLNFYGLLLGRGSYQRMQWQYADYFAGYISVAFLLFAVVSTFLNAMQVELAAEGFLSNQWHLFWQVSRYFSVLVVFLTLTVIVLLFLIFAYRFCREWKYALKQRYLTGRKERVDVV